MRLQGLKKTDWKKYRQKNNRILIPGTQGRVRDHAPFGYIKTQEKESKNMKEPTVIQGYTIIERFPVGEQGFAIGYSETAPAPYDYRFTLPVNMV